MTDCGDWRVEIVGSGPNGLAAAIMLARAGVAVTVREGLETPGGGTRTAELTLPGFKHDVCASVTPLALASPFFSTVRLERHNLRWVQPPIPLAHLLDDGETVFLHRSLSQTASELGNDAKNYLRVFEALVRNCTELMPDLLAPLHFPRHPFLLANFGLKAVLPARTLAQMSFTGKRAQALLGGLAAHSMLPMERNLSAGFGLVLGMLAHAVGWPFVAGGTQKLTDAMITELQLLGGELQTGTWVDAVNLDLDRGPVLLDTSPKGLLNIFGGQLPGGYRASLGNYRYGPGVFKIDWALDGPVPWRDRQCLNAGTLHLGGTLEEIAQSEREVWIGKHPSTPFVIFVQPSLFDDSRAPKGKHTAWAYCHVPHASERSMIDQIESQVERFAPGFRDRILARSAMGPAKLESYNPNYVGGDINVGVQDLSGHFLRPVPAFDPYRTPIDGLFLCSSATPPGGGVHGMCGSHAARSALRWMGLK